MYGLEPVRSKSVGLSAYEGYCGQIFGAALATGEEEVVHFRPGVVAEVIGLTENVVADLRCRISVGLFKCPLDTLYPKFSGPTPAFGDSLGDQQQLILRFKGQDRRFIGDMRE